MSVEQQEILVWPDYTWCEVQDYSNYLHLGDDFMSLKVPMDWDYDKIDEWLEQTKPQG